MSVSKSNSEQYSKSLWSLRVSMASVANRTPDSSAAFSSSLEFRDDSTAANNVPSDPPARAGISLRIAVVPSLRDATLPRRAPSAASNQQGAPFRLNDTDSAIVSMSSDSGRELLMSS